MSTSTVLPIDFPLSQGILLDGGAMLMHLPTLDDLEAFWAKNAHRFSYAAQGLAWGERQSFLHSCEWVFGPTKSAVVSTVCRWDQMGIQYEWYDWASDDPEGHASWFEWRIENREKCINADTWTERDEEEHQRDLIARTPETFLGEWVLSNLPCGISECDWFGPHCKTGIEDRNWSKQTVTQVMQEKTFDSWKAMGADEIEFLTADEVGSVIAYWQQERAIGEDYYGSENEAG